MLIKFCVQSNGADALDYSAKNLGNTLDLIQTFKTSTCRTSVGGDNITMVIDATLVSTSWQNENKLKSTVIKVSSASFGSNVMLLFLFH